MDVPGAEPTAREERYRIQVGNAVLVAIVRELMARQSEDLDADVRAEVAHWGQRPATFDLEVLPHAGETTVLRLVPSEAVHAGVQDAATDLGLGAALFVAHPDGSMQSIELHGNEPAVHDRGALTAFAGRLAGGIHPGRRRLGLVQGTKVFTIYRHGPELRLDLPAQALATEQEGEDSETYTIEPLRPMGGEGGRIEIRIGGHPDEAPHGRHLARGRLLDHDVQWSPESPDTGGKVLRTSFATSDFPVSITITAPAQAQIDALKTIVESMRLSHACNGPSDCSGGERCDHEFCRSH
jgi:hypothetical protein